MKANLKWIFLGIAVFMLLIFAIATAFYFLMQLMKGDAYHLSLQTLLKNDQVVQTVGPSIEPSWYVLGSVKTSGPDGSAAIEYVIEGDKSEAKVYVYATKKAGLWLIDELIVAPESQHERIVVVANDEAR